MGKILSADFSATAFHERAIKCIDEQKYLDAIGFLNSAIKRDGGEIEYYLDLGDCYRLLGSTDGAIKNYCKALDMDKYCEDAYLGLMQTFADSGRPEMALFYLSMGLDIGALSSDYEPDEDFLREEISVEVNYVNEQNNGKKFALLDRYDCEDKLNFAKKLLAGGQGNMAKQVAMDIPPQSKQYIEAQRLVASIEYAFGQVADSLPVCERILEKNPNDIFALSVKMSALHALGDNEGVERMAKIIDGVKVTTKDDMFRVAISFAEVGDDERSAERYKRLNDEYPYIKEIMLPCAIALYNCKQRNTARKIVRDMKKLFPYDTVVSYYSRHIMEGMVERIPVSSELPDGERMRRLHRIEETFSQLQQIEAVSDRLSRDEELYEMVRWVLSNPHSKISPHIADFLTQDSHWLTVIGDLLIDPKVPASIKKDYLSSYLKNGEKKKFSLLVGDIFQTFKVTVPRCEDTPTMRECYYETYAMLAFMASDFSKKLLKAYKGIVKKMSEPTFEPFKIEKKVMCALICYLTKAHPMLSKKRTCCDIFECKEEELQDYLYRLEIEKPE